MTYSRDKAIFQNLGIIGRKIDKKIFSRKFLIGNDSEWPKTYFKMKILISKKSPIMTFLWGRCRFLVFSKNGSHSSNHPLAPKDLTRL